MKTSRRQAKQAVKARLSGAISSNSPKNKKIVFGDDEIETQNNESEAIGTNDDVSDEDFSNEDANDESDSGDEDDAVEEVKGSVARESTQRLRASERETAKDSMSKKKRKKKDDVDIAPAVETKSDDESSESENEEEALLTEDFFKKVDSERADQLQKTKKEAKLKKVQNKRLLGKHTTFVAEDGYKMTDKPQKKDQNIEVVAIGRGDTSDANSVADDERQLLMSATLGAAPSKAAIAFARGSMARGTSKERGADSRKRKSKNEGTWKRSRKVNTLGVGSRPGQAAILFVRKK